VRLPVPPKSALGTDGAVNSACCAVSPSGSSRPSALCDGSLAFGGPAFAERTVWSLGEFSAVAVWLPPGAEADGDAITTLLAETVTPDKHDDTFAVLGQMDTAHPTYRHWYLPWFAVDTALQGRGLGSQLMKPCLQIIDATHLPAYLETPNPRTIPFYQRHGFEVTGEAQAGTCPPITFMLRVAR
jgi:ribosomal protein S18 acetylase RimI-like enzyme